MMMKLIVLLSAFQLIYGYPTAGKNNNGITYAKQSDGPWTVMLEVKGLRCTGSLVNKKYVITAAHCFDELEDHKSLTADIKIYIGEWKTGKDPDCTESEEDANDYSDECYTDKVAQIPPKKLTIHRQYTQKKNLVTKSSYDIAIIELKRPPRESPTIKSIKLPDADTCEDEPDHPLMVTGFGEVKPKHYTNTKKKVFITLFDQAKCKRALALPFDTEKHFCGIGPNNLSTCKGDSGGPIANNLNDVPTLQGIVSFGSPECGHGDTPSGFLRVACFIEWIESTMGIVRNHSDEDTPRPTPRPPPTKPATRPPPTRPPSGRPPVTPSKTTTTTTSRPQTNFGTSVEDEEDIFG
ncbi:granzyme B-like [Chironomus tepperi]|uniref:granzyme B-like n=1 Tax=Chironomus tepperi TaxID=113505 RepID=UPI00391F4C56